MSEDLDEVVMEAELGMEQAVEHCRGEFAKIRTGRANPQLIAHLGVEYYGTKTPLQQLASIAVPEPRMLLVSPFDKSALKEMERALQTSDLGINPSNDGNVIRVIFPDLTEERRREYVKLARERAEESRIGVRNARRAARKEIDDLAAAGDVGDDEAQRASSRLQDLTDRQIGAIDGLLGNKEKELLEV